VRGVGEWLGRGYKAGGRGGGGGGGIRRSEVEGDDWGSFCRTGEALG